VWMVEDGVLDCPARYLDKDGHKLTHFYPTRARQLYSSYSKRYIVVKMCHGWGSQVRLA
jgi:cytolysin (calcineurin-like family phosphatase)